MLGPLSFEVSLDDTDETSSKHPVEHTDWTLRPGVTCLLRWRVDVMSLWPLICMSRCRPTEGQATSTWLQSVTVKEI